VSPSTALGRECTRWTGPVLAIAGGLIWLAWQGQARNAVVSGDPMAVYLPAAEALLRGDGLLSFAHLAQGVGRMPAHPVLLAIALGATDDIGLAARLLGLLSAAVVLASTSLLMICARVRPALIALASILIATNQTLGRAAFEPLPDLPCLAVIMAAAAWAVFRYEELPVKRLAIGIGGEAR